MNNTYKEGLQKGDLVYLKHKIGFFNSYIKMNCLVLDKNYLFKKETKFGMRKFFEYHVLNIENNKLLNLKTQDIRVIKRQNVNKKK